MKRRCLAPLIIVFCAGLAAAQSGTSSNNQSGTSTRQGSVSTRQSAQENAGDDIRAPEFANAQLAMSNADYRVTAGDVYTLAYAAGGNQVVYRIAVDTTYRVRISNLGMIDAAGKTFLRLKAEAEKIVSNNYPLSGAQLVLTVPAIFTVYVRGEVTVAAERQAWALSRLSSLLSEEALTDYSSLRDVAVTPAGGRTRVYDVFRAERDGDLSQDPYVRPGDVITVGRVKRTAAISGAVERPGTYQLLDGENLEDLVARYGGGLTPEADASRVEIIRRVGGRGESGEKIFLGRDDIEGNYELNNLDAVYIPMTSDLTPVMFVEGAVELLNVETDVMLSGANRVTVRYNAGENYASLVRRNRGWFSSESDTRSAYVLRGGERIAMNLNPMLYDSGYRGEYHVEENDTLVIPFRQYFVTVAGAVANPGRYPYIPDRTWDYYVALAGGFDTVRNSSESVVITDIVGKNIGKEDEITPETIITAQTNGRLYYFNQAAPVITAVLSIVTTFISLYMLITR